MFPQADWGVFPAIAGTLLSTGKFKGALEHIEAPGAFDIYLLI